MKGDRDRCLAAGMDGYISKPIRASELFDKVEGVARPARPAQRALPAAAGEGVFDLERALAAMGDDPELLRELAGVFLQECPGLLGEIRNAVSRGDATGLKCSAHSLKGSVDNFAARPAFEAALRLEIMGRDGKLLGAPEALVELERELDRLTPALTALALGEEPGGSLNHTGTETTEKTRS